MTLHAMGETLSSLFDNITTELQVTKQTRENFYQHLNVFKADMLNSLDAAKSDIIRQFDEYQAGMDRVFEERERKLNEIIGETKAEERQAA